MIKIDGFMVVKKQPTNNFHSFPFAKVYESYKLAEDKMAELSNIDYCVAPVYLSKDYGYDVYEVVPDCIHI